MFLAKRLSVVVRAHHATASFSRKTRRSSKKGFHDDEDFSPPPNTEKTDGADDS